MGNLSDSLAFEDDRPLASELVELFRREAEARGRPHTLLLVTKGGTKECARLFDAKPCRNVIVSFSVNSPAAAGRHERGAPPVADRLAAAGRLKKAGWRVRIRIDPMIMGFDYGWVARRVKEIRPERVTLGTLRAERNLLRRVGGNGNGIFGRLERTDDPRSLARYPLDERLTLYRQALAILKGVCPIGLCEETPDVWDALGLDAAAKTCNCGQ
ncbi:MAG: hypothetical protein N3A38_14750 [Planctomycetota bacterium]|nr:hypothetical protein [Planctomycetota bacterium]